jgi:hypothetical protein
MHSLRRCGRAKRETRGAADGKLTIGHIVIHVALAGMRLTPGIFMRSDILTFSKISGACIERGVQIIDLNSNSVRYSVVAVAAVVIRSIRKLPGKWFDPGARTDAILLCI